jgi:hypothetical protein
MATMPQLGLGGMRRAMMAAPGQQRLGARQAPRPIAMPPQGRPPVATPMPSPVARPLPGRLAITPTPIGQPGPALGGRPAIIPLRVAGSPRILGY